MWSKGLRKRINISAKNRSYVNVSREKNTQDRRKLYKIFLNEKNNMKYKTEILKVFFDMSA